MQADLVLKHMPLVRRIAGKLARRRSLDFDDLVQVGAIVLVELAQTFDPARGIPFGAYAVQRVRGAMIDAIRADRWAPRKAVDAAARSVMARSTTGSSRTTTAR